MKSWIILLSIASQSSAKTETASMPQALQVLTESALVKMITCQLLSAVEYASTMVYTRGNLSIFLSSWDLPHADVGQIDIEMHTTNNQKVMKLP